MTDYSRNYNFTAKDALSSGDSNKLIRGSEVDSELDEIVTAIASKANKLTTVTALNNLMKTAADGDLVEATSIKDDGTDVTIAASKNLKLTTAGALYLAGVQVTSTATELNLLDGCTASTANLNLLTGLSGTVWTSANDGSGSGLDADLLDGINSGSFLRSDASDTWSSTTLTLAGTTVNITATNFQIDSVSVTATATELNLLAGKSGTVWTSANDGPGSGLDADLLEGQQGSYYQNASNLNSGTVPSARLPQATTTSVGAAEFATSVEVANFTSGTTLMPNVNALDYIATDAYLAMSNGTSAATISHATIFNTFSLFDNFISIEGTVDLGADAQPYIQLTDDSGSTYETTGYRYTGAYYEDGGPTTHNLLGANGQGILLAASSAEGVSANYKVNFKVTIFDVDKTGYKYFTVTSVYHDYNFVRLTHMTMSGVLTATTNALTGLRFTSSTGTHNWRYIVKGRRNVS